MLTFFQWVMGSNQAGMTGYAKPEGYEKTNRYSVSSKSSRPMSMRRISLVPAPIS